MIQQMTMWSVGDMLQQLGAHAVIVQLVNNSSYVSSTTMCVCVSTYGLPTLDSYCSVYYMENHLICSITSLYNKW